MRNADQQSGAFLKSLSVQIDDSVLRHHIVHQMTRRCHAGTLFQKRGDFALAFSGLRSDRDNRFAALGTGSSVNEVKLSADSGIHIRPDRIRADLPGQINLQSGIDCHDVVVLRNDERIICIPDILHENQRVVVDEIIKFLGSHHETGNQFSAVDLFADPVDDPLFHKRYDVVGKHFRMNSEIGMILQCGKYGIGNRPDPHLQTRPVVNQGSAVASDRDIQLGRRRIDDLHQRMVVHHGIINHAVWNQGISKCARGLFIHHGNHGSGGLHSGERDIHRNAERHISVNIGLGHFDQRHIAFEYTGTVKFLRIAESDGQIITDSLADALPVVGASKKRIRHKNPRITGIGIRRFSERHQLNDTDILQLTRVSAAAKRLHKQFRRIGKTAQIK